MCIRDSLAGLAAGLVTGLLHTLLGIPDLKLSEQPEAPIGKYGRCLLYTSAAKDKAKQLNAARDKVKKIDRGREI